MKLRGFLINPWKRELSEVQVDHDLLSWYKLLHCDCLDACTIAKVAHGAMHIFVDDNGQLHEPPPPFFRVKGYPAPLCGYGLVMCSNSQGETVSVPERITTAFFRENQELLFEVWEQRMDPRDVDPEHII